MTSDSATTETNLTLCGVRPEHLHIWVERVCGGGNHACTRVYRAEEVDAEIARLKEYEWMYKELQK